MREREREWIFEMKTSQVIDEEVLLCHNTHNGNAILLGDLKEREQ
jgi:hypothetical protein